MRSARAGDPTAFQGLVAPHRPALRAFCYRLLGSLADADDAVQETLVAAWKGVASFEGHAAFRTWLYRIATNRCLNAARATRRRAARTWDVPGVVPPEPTRLGDVPWLEPYPADAPDEALGPDAIIERAESISLAFVAALQRVPPRQVAVLVLRDVLGFSAREVADLLELTVDAANSALKRARATLASRRAPAPAASAAPAAPAAQSEAAIVARFTRAYESADVDALVPLLTDDVFISMPPLPHEYVGRDDVRRFFRVLFDAGRRFHLVPTRANGQPAVAAYLRTPTHDLPGVGLFVLTLAGDHIRAMTRFDGSLLARLDLPPTLRR